jgi:uncharacterized membrane protein
MTWYPWIVLLHIIGAFVFVGSHGVAIFMAVRISRERDRSRIAALLDLSSASMAALYVGLVLLLVGGIWAGIVGDWFRFGWIWLALGILVAVTVAMYLVATPFFRTLRAAAGARAEDGETKAPQGSPLSDSEVAALAARTPVNALAGSGFAGLLVILWLMVVKPF